MPIKSQAQRRKFAQLLVEGKITPEVYERWNREAGGAHLPERVRPTVKEKKKNKATKAKAKGKAGSRTKPNAKAKSKRKG